MILVLPIVIALAQMTPERMNTISEALFKIATILLTKYCPQKPANIDTDMRYSAVEVKRVINNRSRQASKSFRNINKVRRKQDKRQESGSTIRHRESLEQVKLHHRKR